ncbi:MAG: hypothetical protein JWP47_306 [Polaromonas sp.]|jgi:hypothetical protein|nr:hypothetical protein [Polaromonas sp.]
MPAEQTLHLVVPFAGCSGPAWPEALQKMPPASLKNLSRLLQRMTLTATDRGDAHSLSPPHERVLARYLGLVPFEGALVDGLIPWAAHHAADATGKAWAFITPCHWAMGREHATLTDPSTLALTEGESQALMAAMQPYFETEGIALHLSQPGRWLAEGEIFRDLPTASLDRVLGRNVDAWLPGAKTAPSLRRLQNEMQMLLYTHPINDQRAANGHRSVNSFWISGTGAMPQPALVARDTVTAPRALAEAAVADDWGRYADAWAVLDAGEVSQLLAHQRSGGAVRLTLCGESNSQTYESGKRGVLARFSSLLSPQPASNVLAKL